MPDVILTMDLQSAGPLEASGVLAVLALCSLRLSCFRSDCPYFMGWGGECCSCRYCGICRGDGGGVLTQREGVWEVQLPVKRLLLSADSPGRPACSPHTKFKVGRNERVKQWN